MTRKRTFAEAWAAEEKRTVKRQRDHLSTPPPAKFRYLDKSNKLSVDGRFDFSLDKPSRPKKRHPKVLEKERRNTVTAEYEAFYEGLPSHINMPVAGVPRDRPRISRMPRYTGSPFDPCERVLDKVPLDATCHPYLSLFPEEETFQNRPSIKLVIPDHLKAMLVDDWENITRSHQLVPLPHPHPFDQIVKDYMAFELPHRPDDSAEKDLLEETMSGLREYFNKALGRILLYKFERQQYIEIRELWEANPEGENKCVADTYGAEHLLRLLVQLPELVAQTNMDQQSVNRLREEITKFTNWLGKHYAKYFVSEYETPGQGYIEKARAG